MEGGGGHRGPGRSDLVRERDSDQRGKRKKEQPDMRRKNWSEALAWSVCGCVCVCVGKGGRCMITNAHIKGEARSSHVSDKNTPSYTVSCFMCT